AAKFSLLGGEADREGLHTATRQEFDLPIDAGPVKFVPYVLGEAAYWGEDITGEPLTRLYGQAGVRMNLPLWRADPNIQSELFNLNGLAHKIISKLSCCTLTPAKTSINFLNMNS
ncbi:MAG: hypothetical protein ACKOU6_04420, partial [Planctomycetota bacterium]